MLFKSLTHLTTTVDQVTAHSINRTVTPTRT